MPPMKNKKTAVVLGIVLALALGLALAVPAEVKTAGYKIDKQLCATKLRFGREAFNRGAYSNAKGYFRQAVQADPLNAKAWAFYDLAVMYDVADQVKRAGSVKVSGAPLPGTLQKAPAGSGTKTPPPPPPPQTTGGAIVEDDEGC
jgi:hypothetical protein